MEILFSELSTENEITIFNSFSNIFAKIISDTSNCYVHITISSNEDIMAKILLTCEEKIILYYKKHFISHVYKIMCVLKKMGTYDITEKWLVRILIMPPLGGNT